MASKLVPNAIAGRGRFGGRQNRGPGGNRFAGPHEEFPLGRSSFMRNFFEWENDFTQVSDFYNEVFTGATGTVPVPDWVQVPLDSPTSAAAAILPNQPYGVLRVTAGTADSSGNQASRVQTGSSLGGPIPLANQLGTPALPTIATGPVADRRIAGGFRFAVTETGTATQSAISLVLSHDEGALFTAQTISGIGGQFGFTKAVGTNVLKFYSRNIATPTTTQLTVGTIVPGTFATASFIAKRTSNSTFQAECFFNGVFVGTYDTSVGGINNHVPQVGNYGPVFALENGVGADCLLDIDYYWFVTERV